MYIYMDIHVYIYIYIYIFVHQTMQLLAYGDSIRTLAILTKRQLHWGLKVEKLKVLRTTGLLESLLWPCLLPVSIPSSIGFGVWGSELGSELALSPWPSYLAYSSGLRGYSLCLVC